MSREHIVRERIGYEQALALVDAVHCAEPGRVAQLISEADLPAVVVLLAAMVDEDRPTSHLLAWTDRLADARLRPGPLPQSPCGSHAAFNRHRSRGEQPCASCWEAERTYQRIRARQRRGRPLSSVPTLEGVS